MKKTEIIEGVIAELNGKYWGIKYQDGNNTLYDFIDDINNAEIHDPKYCYKPTDMTWTPDSNFNNPYYDKLSNAHFINVRKTIITEIEILK